MAAASLPLSGYVGALVGAAALPAAVVYGEQFRRKRRKEAGERAPRETKLLRPAGYGLTQKLEGTFESLRDSFLAMSGFGAMSGMSLAALLPVAWGIVANHFSISQLLAHPDSSKFLAVVLLSSASIAIATVSFIHSRRGLKEVNALRLGILGEQLVGDALSQPRVLAAGYRIFHDVPGDGSWNIDHVAVGPAGVFVLETKARSKLHEREGQAKHEVVFNGRTLQFPKWDDNETVPQVVRNTAWVKKWLGAAMCESIAFHPVIVIPGWYTKSTGNYEVKAMNEIYLQSFLASHKPILAPTVIAAVARCLEERCRTVAF